jgi:pilus assembly protein CpaC
MRTTGRIALPLFILLVAVTIPGIVFADDDSTPSVKLTVGRSAVVDVGSPIQRVSLTSAEVADAMVTSSSQLLVNGKMPGTISMFVWERGGTLKQYEIVVQRDLARLNEQMKRLFPGEPIEAQSNGKSIVLSGKVSNKDLIGKAAIVAGGYVDKPEDVVNMLKLQEGAGSNQVLLRVRFAEVSRSALTELGVGLFTSPIGAGQWLGRSTSGQFPAPTWTDQKWTKDSLDFGADVATAEGKFSISDFLNLFLFSAKYDLGAAIRALQQRGLFESLAEPNLVAESGKEASFLAGGEFPVPIAQGTGNNIGITVQYKEFGIRLSFTPIVNGDRVHLKVRPEVSSLDFSNAVVLNGFRIPALTTRRTESELELNNGQTFAVAGLLNNTMSKTMQKIPGIGDIPILGYLFKSQAAQKDRTELVVMITPEILPNNSPGVTNQLPRMPEKYLDPIDQKKSVPAPAPAFRSQADASPAAPAAVPAAAPANDPAAAAARVQALGPSKTIQQTASAPVAAAPGTAQPQAQPSMTPQQVQTQQMLDADKKALEKAQAQDHAREEAVKAADGKERAKQLDEDRKLQEKAAKEQAKKDAEAAKVASAAAKRQAEIDKAANEAAAKRAAEQAKKQAEIDKKSSKSVNDAEAKLKAAQAAYEAEVAKSKKQQ